MMKLFITKNRKTPILLILMVSFLLSCHIQPEKNNLTLTEIDQFIADAGLKKEQVVVLATDEEARWCSGKLELVALKGKVNHFGFDISTTPPSIISFWENVPGVRVWFSEYPITRELNIRSDETGHWSIFILKFKGVNPEVSFIYEKEGWITTKSNVITITDEDREDLCIQFINPEYYQYALVPGIEAQLSAALGFDLKLENALALTVGKSWANMYDGVMPHGDPGAVILTDPPAIGSVGPLYFDKYAVPDPALTSTSEDGGAAFVNMPEGVYHITAVKPPYTFSPVKFNITQEDKNWGVQLYIATPPDGIVSSNSSGPYQP